MDELGKGGLKGSVKQKENAYLGFVQKRGLPITMHGQVWTTLYTLNHCKMIKNYFMLLDYLEIISFLIFSPLK